MKAEYDQNGLPLWSYLSFHAETGNSADWVPAQGWQGLPDADVLEVSVWWCGDTTAAAPATSLPPARSHGSWVPSSHANAPPAVDPLSAPEVAWNQCHQHWHTAVGHCTKWGPAAAAIGLGSFITTVQGLGSALKTHLAIISWRFEQASKAVKGLQSSSY